MAGENPESTLTSDRPKTQGASPGLNQDESESLLGDQEYKASFGEDLDRTLDIDSWATGFDWEGAVARLKAEISSAVEREEGLRRIAREELLPRLGKRPGAPSEAGVYRTSPSEITKVHEGLLFPGRVEAIDGTSASHDTLPLGITQIGVAVVSYGGVSATFAQRVYRKEIASKTTNAVQAAIEVIDKRDSRSGIGQKDGLSELAHRGIMTYAERKILLDKATADWRMGHGMPAPYELLTGAGSMRLLEASLQVLKRIVEFERFVFVPSAPGERGLLTLGNALAAGEYAIIDTIESRIESIVENGHYGQEHKEQALHFVHAYGPKILYGLYCASEHSPPYLFYAHKKHIHLAARIAIADSILRPARGFPMLIDVADATCSSAFGSAGFLGLIHDAYAQAGLPLKYLGERDTRR